MLTGFQIAENKGFPDALSVVSDVLAADEQYPSEFSFFNVDDCSGTIDDSNYAFSFAADGTIYKEGIFSISDGYAGSHNPVLKPGAECTANSTEETISTPTWLTQLSRCGLDGSQLIANACDNEELCVPIAPSGFSSRLCIYRTGDVQCPLGYSDYVSRTVFYGEDSFSDNRDCADDCTCGLGTANCGGQLYYSDTSDTKYIQDLGVCEHVPDVEMPNTRSVNVEWRNASTADIGCPPSGNTNTGSITLKDPITFCCEP